ncbi:MAG: barstar family protein [Propioniciclava sp.]
MIDRLSWGMFSTRAPADAVAGDWRLAGWSPRVLRVETDDRSDARRAALLALGQALGFPDSYGTNLDALWDCLRDLRGSTVLIWAGGEAFADAHPGAWKAISATLVERTQQQPPFAVVLSGTGSSRR